MTQRLTNPSRLSDLFVAAADTLVGGFDLVDFLHGVATGAAKITGSSAIGLLLAERDGGLRVIAASSEDPELLGLFSIQRAEGPCLDAHRAGAELPDIDLRATHDPWPDFTSQATALGFTGTHCFPLRLRGKTVGAMHAFQDDGHHLSADERRSGRALADLAAISLVQERATRRPGELTEQVLFALNSRIVIEQAKGTVALNLDVGVAEAFELLRVRAAQHRMPLTELARAVVADRGALDTLLAEPSASELG